MERVATLRVTLVRAADDEAAFSPNYQRELKFYHLVRADHTRISAIAFTMPGVSDDSGFTGEFAVPLSQDFDVGTASALEALVTRAQALLVGEAMTVKSERTKT